MTQLAHAETNGKSKVTPLHFPPPFPTPAALAIERAPWDEIEDIFMRGPTPDPDALVGWEFRGINRFPLYPLPIPNLLGIKKFVKGFYRADDGRVMGYNCPVEQNILDGRWRTKPSDTAPKRFGFYEVHHVDATSRDNTYLHAVLLYLGKAYYAIGPARLRTNFFILERLRRGLTNYARR
jgi:hypothetical protein